MKYLIILSIFLTMGSCSAHRPDMQATPTFEQELRTGQPIYISEQKFKNKIDFTTYAEQAQMSQGLSEGTVASTITFVNCTFEQPVVTNSLLSDSEQRTAFSGSISFVECTFEDEVNFRNSRMSGLVDFSGSIFRDKVTFEGCSFMQHGFFKSCTFEGEVRFQNAYFHQRASFFDSRFYENASYQRHHPPRIRGLFKERPTQESVID